MNGEEAELEELRRKKLEQMQQAQEAQAQRQQAEMQARAQIEGALRPLLTQDAWDQWNSAKFSNEKVAYTAAMTIVKAGQTGQLPGKLNVEQLKAVLSAVNQQTRVDWNIKRA